MCKLDQSSRHNMMEIIPHVIFAKRPQESSFVWSDACVIWCKIQRMTKSKSKAWPNEYLHLLLHITEYRSSALRSATEINYFR